MICRREFDFAQKRLVFFWKKVLFVIEKKFASGEVEFSQKFLPEIIKLFDEINEKDDLAAVVERIISTLINSNTPYHLREMFQKNDGLSETMQNDFGSADYCKFIRRLHLSHVENSVHRFCDELSRAISFYEAGKSGRKRLLVFWNSVFHLIVNKLPPGEAEFSENLLSEVRQIMIDTFSNEIKLIPSSVNRIIKSLEVLNNQRNLAGIFDPEENASVVELAPEEIEVRVAYIDLSFLLKLEISEDNTQKFNNQLYQRLAENSTYNLRTICILFWKRVFCFVDDIPNVENGADCSNQLIDTILDLLDDTFFGGGYLLLAWKNFEEFGGLP